MVTDHTRYVHKKTNVQEKLQSVDKPSYFWRKKYGNLWEHLGTFGNIESNWGSATSNFVDIIDLYPKFFDIYVEKRISMERKYRHISFFPSGIHVKIRYLFRYPFFIIGIVNNIYLI